MKKSVLAVCLAALPVAAVADVTLYGQVKSGITGGQVKIEGAQGTEKVPLPYRFTTTVHVSALRAARISATA